MNVLLLHWLEYLFTNINRLMMILLLLCICLNRNLFVQSVSKPCGIITTIILKQVKFKWKKQKMTNKTSKNNFMYLMMLSCSRSHWYNECMYEYVMFYCILSSNKKKEEKFTFYHAIKSTLIASLYRNVNTFMDEYSNLYFYYIVHQLVIFCMAKYTFEVFRTWRSTVTNKNLLGRKIVYSSIE